MHIKYEYSHTVQIWYYVSSISDLADFSSSYVYVLKWYFFNIVQKSLKCGGLKVSDVSYAFYKSK